MDTLELKFEFDDLSIVLRGEIFKGLLIGGEALLTGDEDGFSVDLITLNDGPVLKRRGNGVLGFPAAFEDEFFKRIASEIENPKRPIGNSAHRAWADLVEDYTSPESIAAAKADAEREMA